MISCAANGGFCIWNSAEGGQGGHVGAVVSELFELSCEVAYEGLAVVVTVCWDDPCILTFRSGTVASASLIPAG